MLIAPFVYYLKSRRFHFCHYVDSSAFTSMDEDQWASGTVSGCMARRFVRALLVWGCGSPALAGAHTSVGRGRGWNRVVEGREAGMPSYLQLGRLSISCMAGWKQERQWTPSPGAEGSRGLSLVPGPGECLSGLKAEGQGVEAQLQGFAARDPMGQGQWGRSLSAVSLIWRTIGPPRGPPYSHPQRLWGPHRAWSCSLSGVCVGWGEPELFSGLEWGLRSRPSTTNGVLGMRVFGKKPWAVLGANPQTPTSVLKSVPYAPHTHLWRTI